MLLVFSKAVLGTSIGARHAVCIIVGRCGRGFFVLYVDGQALNVDIISISWIVCGSQNTAFTSKLSEQSLAKRGDKWRPFWH